MGEVGAEELEYLGPGGVVGVGGGVGGGGPLFFKPCVVQVEVLEGVFEGEQEGWKGWGRNGDAVELEAAERRYVGSGGELVDCIFTELCDGGEAEFF